MDESLIGKVFERPETSYDAAGIQLARELGVATIAAAIGEPKGRERLIVRTALKRVAGKGTAAGPAVTVWNPGGNNTMIRFGVESCRPGDILIIYTPADAAAQWGDNAHLWAKGKKIEAVIVDGAVRDVAIVREIGISLWARCIDPRQALKESPGFVNAPIALGGVEVLPGDFVVADDDAILVLRPGEVKEALRLAKARAESEDVIRAEGSTGATPSTLKKIFHGDRITKVGRPWSEADGRGKV